MRKKLVISIFVLILICIGAGAIYINYLKTDESVTGEATNSNFGLSITILGTNPIVNIIYPENETYITNKNLWLNYSSNNTQFVWYQFDSDPNTTLTGNTTFNISEGAHILYLYANSTDGNETSDSVNFYVNSSKFKVIYGEYAGQKRGSSTKFNKSSYKNLQNLSGIILENTDWGSIVFYENINVTDDSNFSDYETNLDMYTNISENRIEINSTALPNFNKSAMISFYNVGFTNPIILRDGSVCPNTICTELNSSGGNLSFNVTQFTVYSIEEGIIGAPVGGGGGGISEAGSFGVNPEEIKIKIKQGEIKSENLTIINNGTKRLNFELEIPNRLKDLLRVDESSFSLNSGESKTLILDIIARDTTIPDLYAGKVKIKANGLEKEIFVVIEIESKEALLDVRTEILEEYKKVVPGEEILSEIRLFNLGEKERQDILLEYIIEDYEGNEIYKGTESLAIETQISFIKRIYIPKGTEDGKYIFYVRATYGGKISSASDNFDVVSRKITTQEKIYIGIILILIVTISVGIYHIISRRKKTRRKEEGKELFHLIGR